MYSLVQYTRREVEFDKIAFFFRFYFVYNSFYTIKSVLVKTTKHNVLNNLIINTFDHLHLSI